MGGDAGQRGAAFGGLAQQRLAGRHGLGQAVDAAVCAGSALGRDQVGEMGRVFDLPALVEGPRMRGDDSLAVEDTDLRERGGDLQRAAYVGVRHRVVVQVEAHVGGLADADLDPLIGRVRIVGQADQVRALFGEDLGDGAVPGLPDRAVGHWGRYTRHRPGR